MRNILHLNFDWRFGPFDPSHLRGLGLEHLKPVDLPHNAVDIPYNNFNEQMTLGVFTYVKDIMLPESDQKKVYRIIFEGVAHQATVYLNQTCIGSHKGGYTPFDIEISDAWVFGKSNQLMVIVDTTENKDIPPFGGVVDYLGYGGIYREVRLEMTDPSYVKDVFVEQNGTKDLKVHVQVSKPHGQMQMTIRKQNGEKVFIDKMDLHVTRHTVSVSLNDIILWDIDRPHLYTIEIEYFHGHERDALHETFGIRSAVFKKDGFYLNGKKIKLRGLNRHQSYPYVGYAMPKSAQEEDADLLKHMLGVNVVRTSHYPQSKHFLNRCDAIGLLVFEEIPGWQHIGDDAWKKQALHDVSDMIQRDRNHPSIILWGVRINESPDSHDFYVATNELARTLDPSRQTGGVRNMANSEFLEDVYTYNDFSHTGNNDGLSEKKSIVKVDVPYLVTEYNGHMFPTKRYDDETKRNAHASRHLNVLNAMMKENNGISGCIGWCMNDYNTHQEFGSGDKICYHGVLDMFRIPKIAAYAYMAEGVKEPFMEVSSTMNIGEYPGGNLPNAVIYTNLDEVKVYKNDQFIASFQPNRVKYPHLLHPPVEIDDLIGDTLMEQEHMSRRDADMTKGILKSITTHGNRLSLRHKLQTLYLLKKYKMTYDEGVKMFFRYMSGWGTKGMSYRFEGYQNKVHVKTVIKENTEQSSLTIETSARKLCIGDTYDVKRFVVRCVNQLGELLPYASDPLVISASGSIDVIGPKIISLQGGAIGFWVRTLKKGEGKLTITHQNQVHEIEVDVL